MRCWRMRLSVATAVLAKRCSMAQVNLFFVLLADAVGAACGAAEWSTWVWLPMEWIGSWRGIRMCLG